MIPDVVILPSFAQVEDWRKRHAAGAAQGLFAQTVTTFNAWVADLWELHGDGRAIVDSLQRQTIMQAAFERAAEDVEAGGEGAGHDGRLDGAGLEGRIGRMSEGAALTVSPGVVKLAAQCVREAAGVPAFERAVGLASTGAVPDGLALREAVLLQVVQSYYDLLAQAGLVEVGQAAAHIANNSSTVFPRPVRVLLAQASPPDWRMQAFFSACGNVRCTVDEAPGASGVGVADGGASLRFGFPSGRYAQPALVADLVRGFTASGSAFGSSCKVDMVVACKDPLSLYKHIEQALAEAGVVGCVQAQVPFSSTDFGRRFLSLCRVIEDDDWAKADLSDAVRPPFSGFESADALRIDRALRSNRLSRKDDCLASLRVASDTFSQLEEVASDPEADILLGVFEQIAFTSPARSEAWRAEQLSALAAVRSCAKAARAVGASMRSCVRVLEDVVVAVSYESAWAGGGLSAPAGRVLVTTQAVAAQMGAGSCGDLVLCDLTSDDYPVADKDDAAATLFAKLGLPPFDSMLARERRRFAALQVLPVGQLVCLRPLNDWDGNPTYPAAMLQELVDACRADLTAQDDLDELYSIPYRFIDTMAQRGEESLFANAAAAPADAAQPTSAAVPQGSMGDMPPASIARVALLRTLPDGSSAGFSPSPSQVEQYLECPYKWFAQRRLNIEELDEGFGPLERGSFSHAVLQRFYQEFIAEGFAKVNEQNLDRAKELMLRVAGDEAQAQRTLKPGGGRYVAANQIELRELEGCIDQLVAYLDFEARFLPAYRPAHLEYQIGLQDGVTYAGHPFMGIVDRIDVDADGNAVIVDYKGSVGPAHEIAGKGSANPGKVQTRMYARAVERALGLRVVGALYVSYGASRGCAGAFDGRALEAAHLPGMRVDRCSCAAESPVNADEVDDYAQLTFSDMLDRTESLVEAAIESMQTGDVAPAPATSEACRYCPVANCPKRGA